MHVKYTYQSKTLEFELSDAAAEDLAVMCPEIENRLRTDHWALAERPFLAEKIADAALNSLSDDSYVIDLGDIAS